MLMCCLSCAKADSCEQADRVEDFCINHEERPMTNADRIRQMSDEEMAALLVMRDLSCVIKFNEALGNYAHLHYDKESSVKSVLGWLKAPVEVDDG